MNKCKTCGCTEEKACQPKGCHWIDIDLCSACSKETECKYGDWVNGRLQSYCTVHKEYH